LIKSRQHRFSICARRAANVATAAANPSTTHAAASRRMMKRGFTDESYSAYDRAAKTLCNSARLIASSIAPRDMVKLVSKTIDGALRHRGTS
jgi:hypothetical protein